MKRPSCFLIFLLIICVAFAFGYAAIESVHDCHGEDCPICRIIALFNAFLGVFAWLIVALAGSIRSEMASHTVRRAFAAPVTPVALKVKLSN